MQKSSYTKILYLAIAHIFAEGCTWHVSKLGLNWFITEFFCTKKANGETSFIVKAK